MDNYEIKLDRRVLKQLGSQLYGDTPSVIAELVANSYDADANNVWITIDTVNNIDISFSDIEKPSNNALSSIKFQQIRTPDQTITVTEFFKTIIEEGLHFEYDESKLQKALNYVLKTDKYSDQKIDFPATFLPKRKFIPVPRCPKCHNIMLLTEENGRLKYVCSNVSCDECYEAVIN